MLLKSERPQEARRDTSGEVEKEPGITQTYHLLWRIIKLPAVKSFIVILLTCKVQHNKTYCVNDVE